MDIQWTTAIIACSLNYLFEETPLQIIAYRSVHLHTPQCFIIGR